MEIGLFLAALAIAIAVGFFTKANAGLVAMVFAACLGILVCGFSLNAILALWPIKLFLMLAMVMLFYGFAMTNGTLALLSEHITYSTRKVPWLLPIALWAFCLAVSAAGVGPFGVFAILGPTVMAIAMKAGIPRLLAAVTVISGGSIGALSPISTGGIVVGNYAELVGYGDIAGSIIGNVFVNLLIAQGLVFAVVYIVQKGWKPRTGEIARPAKMNRNQKVNLALIVIVLVLTFIPAMLSAMTGAAWLTKMAKVCDVTITSALGAVLCGALKVGSEKDAFRSVPWGTVFLISGMCLLINTAVEYGIVDSLSAWLTSNVESAAVIYLLIVIAGVMSFFSSTLGVVVPTLSTLVPALAAITGATPGLLFSLITVSAMLSGYSPFSSSGGITMSGLQDEAERKRLYIQLLAGSPILVACFAVLVAVGVIA